MIGARSRPAAWPRRSFRHPARLRGAAPCRSTERTRGSEREAARARSLWFRCPRVLFNRFNARGGDPDGRRVDCWLRGAGLRPGQQAVHSRGLIPHAAFAGTTPSAARSVPKRCGRRRVFNIAPCSAPPLLASSAALSPAQASVSSVSGSPPPQQPYRWLAHEGRAFRWYSSGAPESLEGAAEHVQKPLPVFRPAPS